MPLPAPAARQHLHNRDVAYRGYRRDDGGWDIEGEMRDTKTYDIRVVGERVRVITALVASPGLKTLGERFPQLTLYSACIDPELDDQNRPLPGLGDVETRLFGPLEQECLG